MASAGIATAHASVEAALAWEYEGFLPLVQSKLKISEQEARERIVALKQFLITVSHHPGVALNSPQKIDEVWHWLILFEEARSSFFRTLGTKVVHDPRMGGPVQPDLLKWAHEIFPGQVQEQYWFE